MYYTRDATSDDNLYLRNTTRGVDVMTDAFENARRLVLPSLGARYQIVEGIHAAVSGQP